MSSRHNKNRGDVAVASIATKEPHALPVFPTTSKASVFTLSFWSYCAMKVSNKSYSLIQPILVKERFFTSEIFDSNYSGQTSMVGMISTVFLICYASGQFFAGALADRSNLRYFICMAMALAGLLAAAFGVMGALKFRHVSIYCVIWALNGFAQACGWPSNLSVMNNWFGKKARGLVFSAWSSNSNVGNILGSVLCGLIFWMLDKNPDLWQLTMVLCGLVSVFGVIPVFLFLVPDPADMEMQTAWRRDSSPPSTPCKTVVIQVVPKDPEEEKDEEEGELAQGFENEDNEAEDVAQQSTRMRRASLDYVDVEGDSTATMAKTLKPASTAPTMSFYASFTSALGKRGVLPYAVIYACVKGVVYVYIYWMPLFLTSSKGMTNSQAAYVSTIFDIGAFVGGLFFGHVTDIIGSRTMVILGMVFSGTILAGILFTTESSIMLICAILFFIGMSAGAAQILISGSVALDLGDSGGDEGEGPDDESKSKRQAATITGIIEGSGSAGAALLQYAVGALLVCDDSDEGDNVTCTWDRVLLVLTIANVLSFCCLLYLKFAGRARSLITNIYSALSNNKAKRGKLILPEA